MHSVPLEREYDPIYNELQDLQAGMRIH